MVKRYKGDEIHGFMFPDYDSQAERWVDSADYDALAAELDGYKESHEKYCPSAARIRDLEAQIAFIEGHSDYASDAVRAARKTTQDR
jgi:hypothetical protein